MKIYILGGAGNGLVIAATIERNMDNVQVEFLNDVDKIGTGIGKFRKIYVSGRTEEIKERLEDKNTSVISAYGGFTDPVKTLKRLKALNIAENRWMRFADSTAVIPYDYCQIKEDTFIGPLVQLSPNVEIGAHCSLFGNAFIGHDTVVGEFCHLATNCVVGSSVTIGSGVHIGINSCIREHTIIGDNSVIGAGAVVVKDVPPGAFVVGNPAKVLKYR